MFLKKRLETCSISFKTVKPKKKEGGGGGKKTILWGTKGKGVGEGRGVDVVGEGRCIRSRSKL